MDHSECGQFLNSFLRESHAKLYLDINQQTNAIRKFGPKSPQLHVCGFAQKNTNSNSSVKVNQMKPNVFNETLLYDFETFTESLNA